MGPRGSGIELDPLVGLDDARKPLRSRILAVPGFKARYLEHLRTIAQESLDWKKLAPLVEQYRSLVDKEIEADTRKLESYAMFTRTVSDTVEPEAKSPGRGMSLRAFAEGRSKFLLNHPEIKGTPSLKPLSDGAKE